jgi:ATP/maltotriose-dependent transcriptional regulator MalT
MDEAGAAIARQLNGPLTALLLYMGEIKQRSHQISQVSSDRVYLQQVVENALQQTERVCAMMKQIAGSHDGLATAPGRKSAFETRPSPVKEAARIPGVMFASAAGQKPLTKREREVLGLISEGYSNKQGTLRMRISPPTFQSHRAEAMAATSAASQPCLLSKNLPQNFESAARRASARPEPWACSARW